MGTTKREGVLTISNFLAIKKMWAQISFALVFFTLVSGKNRTDYLYNGDGKVVLSLEKPFKVEILNKDGEVKATFNLPAAKEAAIKGSKTKNDFALDIDYSGGSIKGDKGSLSDAKFKFDITYNTSTGYWYLKGLTTNLQGSIDGGDAINIADEALDVDSNPGVTSRTADQSCERGYLTCAPKNLCWYCDDQIFKSLEPKTYTSRITLPGATLQPFFSNGTSSKVRFGYEWNCDPLIPLGVWVSLLLTLTLLTFLYWAIDMLVNLQTPNRFDDPRGKPLSVPMSE